MKTISLWQPHGTLIMLGVKPYETRSWPAPKRLIGKRIGIHAAKCPDDLRELADYVRWRKEGGDIEPGFEAMRETLANAGYKTLGNLPRGCLLGSVILQASYPTEGLRDPGHFGNFAPSRHAWQMVDPIVLAEPVPFRGQQGFFHVPDELFSGLERVAGNCQPPSCSVCGKATTTDHAVCKRCTPPPSAMVEPNALQDYYEFHGQMRLIP